MAFDRHLGRFYFRAWPLPYMKVGEAAGNGLGFSRETKCVGLPDGTQLGLISRRQFVLGRYRLPLTPGWRLWKDGLKQFHAAWRAEPWRTIE